MPTSAVIKIEQFDSPSNEGRVSDRVFTTSSIYPIRETNFALSSEFLFTHLPHITQPVAAPALEGWVTEDEDDWKDSPSRAPLLLYRHRFAFGRDRKELFNTGYGSNLLLGAAGARWGNLDENSGALMYERVYPLSSQGSVRQFATRGQAVAIRDIVTGVSSSSKVSHIGGIEGDTTLEMFPFLIAALPEPFSEKNPTDTDVFIRISNFANPIASGTISLFIDDVLREPIQINEFFGGLGGFDITWNNNQLFEYDATVNVRLQFSDTDVPAHQFNIRYPFYTVPDLAPPRITNLIPADLATDVSIYGPIRFTIVDFEVGVNIGSLRLYVNNVLIQHGFNGTIEASVLEDGSGYDVVFTPAEPWLYGDLIPVAIFVKDSSLRGNEKFFSYSFTTELSDSPRLINIHPAPCTIAVPTGEELSVDVIDGGHGLQKDSLLLSVDEIDCTGTILLIPIVHRDE